MKSDSSKCCKILCKYFRKQKGIVKEGGGWGGSISASRRLPSRKNPALLGQSLPWGSAGTTQNVFFVWRVRGRKRREKKRLEVQLYARSTQSLPGILRQVFQGRCLVPDTPATEPSYKMVVSPSLVSVVLSQV